VDDEWPLNASELVDPRRGPLARYGANALIEPTSNAVGTFAPFAALVIVWFTRGQGPKAMTAFLGGLLFLSTAARIARVPACIPLVRTLIFTLGYVTIVGMSGNFSSICARRPR